MCSRTAARARVCKKPEAKIKTELGEHFLGADGFDALASGPHDTVVTIQQNQHCQFIDKFNDIKNMSKSSKIV